MQNTPENLNRMSDTITPKKQFYSSAQWRKLRALKLVETPNCPFCQNLNRITPSTEVHHIIKFHEQWNDDMRWALFTDPDNCIALCREHHKDIHQTPVLLTPVQSQYLEDMKNWICNKYYQQNIIIKYTNDKNH